MLNNDTIQIIKATAPVVGAHARDITEVFYPLLFERYPEVKYLFNETNQKTGRQRQALANAVVAYATHIDKLQNLGSAVATITHKHASLGIKPEHYPLVGECLLDAIKAVLDDAATDDIINAWAAAYGQLAEVLIGAEQAIYDNHEKQQGGWQGFQAFTVTKKVAESDVITSFYLKPNTTNGPIRFLAGQYIGVRTEIDGKLVTRNYSLSDAPDKDYLRISVKRENGGVFSNHLHSHIHEGDELLLSPPSGEFTLKQNNKPLYLITGGVGITPAISMLNQSAATGRPIRFIHAALNGNTHAFKQHVQALQNSHENIEQFTLYSEPTETCTADHIGLIDQNVIESLLPEDKQADIYFLGPTPFMRTVKQALDALEVDPNHVAYEFFGPDEALAG